MATADGSFANCEFEILELLPVETQLLESVLKRLSRIPPAPHLHLKRMYSPALAPTVNLQLIVFALLLQWA